ncbi:MULTISPECIES: D-alanine--D-alanine ligase [Empedobacter]|uniref:D-alanine--D-alanine ligase n=3 Tax=Empedobacter TaxID=59734 RepID=A0A376GF75_9FLAO|nr:MULTISPECIES: D-alanine--D-alanine ligase [Empedobacter]MBY0065813.1 D-alanine--D-alanine ligase [Empedobacter falsenii]MDH1602628.1 D-alanine--D-alanine ligase [Empedobacter sp. GD03739]MDM1137306.1 D-alanine--D-alanine ligase [Empedobacter sp. R132-2]RRT94468.1 D-alanine--D-alanine ligase [Empedobacter falsenii]RRT94714.1 D-alanine--D-alanine ligase [Empedobacter falsenii]
MLRVAVVAGGYTDESVISLKSCELIYSSLNPEKYDRTRVRILKEGWFAEIEGEKYPINKGDFSFEKNGEKITFDVVFNTIHGTPGEDGYLQAYFEMIGLPYNGCPFYQSALTFNKKDCIAVLSKYGIPHAKSIYLNQGDQYSAKEIIDQVGLPCFVKPNRSGSSLGISKVHKEDEFEAAMQKAFLEDKEVLIESFLDGTEISVGVLNYKGETMVLGITEIVSHTEFFDYDAKYNGLSDEITPARLTPEVEARVREIAAKAYKCINMSGFSRSEYIIVNGEPHFIEMNTLPGFSPASIFPQQAAHAGIALEDLMDSEIEFALNRPSAWIE